MDKIFEMLNRKIQTPCDINEHLKKLFHEAHAYRLAMMIAVGIVFFLRKPLREALR